MGRAANTSPVRKRAPAALPGKHANDQLNLTALQQTPGFMIRILQLQIFEAFFAHFSPSGFSPAEYSVLVTVRDNPSVTQSELAVALRIQLPNLVKILLKLEATELLNRKRSVKDKRAMELNLSAKGRDAVAQAAAMAEIFNLQTLSALSKHEQKAFLGMLTRLVNARSGVES